MDKEFHTIEPSELKDQVEMEYSPEDLYITVINHTTIRADGSSQITEQNKVMLQVGNQMQEYQQQITANVFGVDEMVYAETIGNSTTAWLGTKGGMIMRTIDEEGRERFTASNNTSLMPAATDVQTNATPADIMKIQEFSKTLKSHKDTVPLVLEDSGSITVYDARQYRHLNIAYKQRQFEIDADGNKITYEVDRGMTYMNQMEGFNITRRFKDNKIKTVVSFKPHMTIEGLTPDQNGMVQFIILDSVNGREIGAPKDRKNVNSANMDVEIELFSAKETEYCESFFNTKSPQMLNMETAIKRFALPELIKASNARIG